ncbi:MAG: hypothetical protein HY648_02930 [Acidobacteria bacterium]|nr:hypothetical protein [Acidobacteriota bacterium]
MKLRISLIALILFAIGVMKAQAEPLQTQVIVDLPYEVNLGDVVLWPAEYSFRQMPGTSVLQIVRNPHDPASMKVEASLMAIPAELNRASEETQLVLQRHGDTYYLANIWIQGRGSGFEFPLPESAKALERERNTVLTGRVEPLYPQEQLGWED